MFTEHPEKTEEIFKVRVEMKLSFRFKGRKNSNGGVGRQNYVCIKMDHIW